MSTLLRKCRVLPFHETSSIKPCDNNSLTHRVMVLALTPYSSDTVAFDFQNVLFLPVKEFMSAHSILEAKAMFISKISTGIQSPLNCLTEEGISLCCIVYLIHVQFYEVLLL